jgi:D-glycero-D-manno-heptose 1,7-bisphosphate phosphatase
MPAVQIATTRLVILDRDGVINVDSEDYIKTPDEWSPLPGALEGIAELTNAGLMVAVATNQSGLARGLFDIDTLNRIHGLMCARAAMVGGRIDAIGFCPHGPWEGCPCRKPAPGLLLGLARRLAVPLSAIVMIGDSRRDLDAAIRAGIPPILVRSGNGEQTAKGLPADLRSTVPVYADLQAVAAALVSGSQQR